MRFLPLLMLGFAALAARLFAHDGERVGAGSWEFPHLCPARQGGGECLGCGATRASLDMLQGDFAGAWQLQPFVFLFPLVLGGPAGWSTAWIGLYLVAAWAILIAAIGVVSTAVMRRRGAPASSARSGMSRR